jgi:hypothetical protein
MPAKTKLLEKKKRKEITKEISKIISLHKNTISYLKK